MLIKKANKTKGASKIIDSSQVAKQVRHAVKSAGSNSTGLTDEQLAALSVLIAEQFNTVATQPANPAEPDETEKDDATSFEGAPTPIDDARLSAMADESFTMLEFLATLTPDQFGTERAKDLVAEWASGGYKKWIFAYEFTEAVSSATYSSVWTYKVFKIIVPFVWRYVKGSRLASYTPEQLHRYASKVEARGALIDRVAASRVGKYCSGPLKWIGKKAAFVANIALIIDVLNGLVFYPWLDDIDDYVTVLAKSASMKSKDEQFHKLIDTYSEAAKKNLRLLITGSPQFISTIQKANNMVDVLDVINRFAIE